MDRGFKEELLSGTWACWCGSKEDLIIYTSEIDPERIPRAEGEIVPIALALCKQHDTLREKYKPKRCDVCEDLDCGKACDCSCHRLLRDEDNQTGQA